MIVPLAEVLSPPVRHAASQAILRLRLRKMVKNYHTRTGAATPHSYARQRLGIPKADLMVLAETLAGEGAFTVLNRHFLPAKSKLKK